MVFCLNYSFTWFVGFMFCVKNLLGLHFMKEGGFPGL